LRGYTNIDSIFKDSCLSQHSLILHLRLLSMSSERICSQVYEVANTFENLLHTEFALLYSIVILIYLKIEDGVKDISYDGVKGFRFDSLIYFGFQ